MSEGGSDIDWITPSFVERASPDAIRAFTGQCDVVRWFERLSRFTIATAFIDLTADEAKAIMSGGKPLSVSKKIDGAIERSPEFKASGVFVRLTTRSPKDAVLRSPALRDAFSQELAATAGSKDPDNDEMVALYRAVITAGRVRHGEEAVALLADSTRVREDLQKWIDTASPSEAPPSICVREWRKIEPATEFRCFVFRGVATAVCQYLDDVYFDSLSSSDSWLPAKVGKFVSEISPLLPGRSCVLDLSIPEQGDPILIEVNPFCIKTGAVMFKWDRDAAILTSPAPAIPVFRRVESHEKARSIRGGPGASSQLRSIYLSPKDSKQKQKCVVC